MHVSRTLQPNTVQLAYLLCIRLYCNSIVRKYLKSDVDRTKSMLTLEMQFWDDLCTIMNAYKVLGGNWKEGLLQTILCEKHNYLYMVRDAINAQLPADKLHEHCWLLAIYY